MAISAVINEPKETIESYPKLRLWIGDVNRSNPPGPLIVLFTSEKYGVPLSGVYMHRIGIPEDWVSCENTAVWKKVHSVIITSED